MSEQPRNGRWLAIAGAVVPLLALGAAVAIAWGSMGTNVTSLKTRHEKRLDKIEHLQFSDGRDMAKLSSTVEAIKDDVADIKKMLEEMRHHRRPRWTRRARPDGGQ